MKIGVQLRKFEWDGGTPAIAGKLTEFASQFEAAGGYSLWMMDHLYQLEPLIGKVDDPMLESYSALNYLAGQTQTLKLGTLVTGVIFRNPGLLVKQVTTLDVLSGGRAYLGIGAAWYVREALGLGIPFPKVSLRFEMLEETLQIALKMWSGDRTPYDGKHYQMAELISVPQPLTRPHPPIMIGGMGEQKTLRLVAKYANACNLFATEGIAVVRDKLDILKRHCDTLGRDYDAIERTTLWTADLRDGAMSPAEVVSACRDFEQVGIQHMILGLQTYDDLSFSRLCSQVIPALA